MEVLFAGLSFFVTDALAQQDVYARNDKPSGARRAEEPVVYDEITSFILHSVATRMMIAEEGRLASKEGTTSGIKEYGELMIKDQGRLLGELKRIAVLRDLKLPEKFEDREPGSRSERPFNNAYIKTMIAEHERDIRLFRKAVNYGDPEVSEFARRYLPVVESHLEKIKSIRKN